MSRLTPEEVTARNSSCSGCEFVENKTVDFRTWQCNAPENKIEGKFNVVTGRHLVVYSNCHEARLWPEGCGSSAAWRKSKWMVDAAGTETHVAMLTTRPVQAEGRKVSSGLSKSLAALRKLSVDDF